MENTFSDIHVCQHIGIGIDGNYHYVISGKLNNTTYELVCSYPPDVKVEELEKEAGRILQDGISILS